MSDKHKNKQDMWKFEDILGTLGLTGERICCRSR